MEMESCVPPGFRFHPTEEELVGYYLRRKINSLKIDLDVIIDIDLYKIEPWDIQERCKSSNDEQNEWYFFSHKDKKYPTGTRTNRATAAGFWKATGRDKAVLSKNRIIGMRKTLVFYRGRAPNGRKSDWIMHEYRLQTSEYGPPQEEGWVVCRAFKKPTPNHRQGFEAAWNHAYYVSRDNSSSSSSHLIRSPTFSDIGTSSNVVFPNSQNLGANLYNQPHNPAFLDNQIFELPQLDDSPTISTSLASKNGVQHINDSSHDIDWKNLDILLESQLTDTISLPHPNPSHDFELEHHVDPFLGCFPNS